MLDVPYTEQLADKQRQIEALFKPLGIECEPMGILGMDAPFRYRDKVIAPFVKDRKRGIISGMYAKGTHRVIDTPSCILENEVAAKVVAAIKAIMKRHDIEPYNEDTGKGFLRHAVIRVGHTSGEVLVTLVTNTEDFPHSKSFCREMVKKVPAVTTVVQNVNTRQTNVVLGQQERRLYGPGFILDGLCGLSFRISSTSFYQVNSKQTEVLYNAAMKLAQLKGNELVVDAYCGTGTIGLVAMHDGGAANGSSMRLIGVDSEESSIRDARQNAKHNGIESAEFVVADAAEYMDELASRGGEDGPMVLFMDPPRAGSTEKFLNAAARLAPERIVYISCNPQTQVRDVEHMLRRGYEVQAIQPVDMFPHTPHIECIVLLAKGRE